MKNSFKQVPKRKLVVGYVRVSTMEQSRDGISIDHQKAKIREYCRLNDLDLLTIYVDMKSARSLAQRGGLQNVMNLVRKSAVDHVICYRLDRLARNATDTLNVAEQMKEKKVGLHFIRERIDTKSPIGRFFFVVLAAFAEMESGIKSEMIRDNMAYKKEQGGRVSRHAPYGWKFKLDRVVPEPREIKAVKRAVELHSEGGRSLREIAKELRADGFKSRAGTTFSAGSVKKMIENFHLIEQERNAADAA